MAVTKLLNLLAVASLAILASSYGPSSVHALSIDNPHNVVARSQSHAAIVQKRSNDSNTKRCKARSAPTTHSSVKVAPTTSAKAVSTSVHAAAPTQSAHGSGSSTNGIPKVGLGWANQDNTALARFKTKNVGPLMTWSPWIPDVAKSLGFTPCPMLWGDKQTSQFQSLVVEGYANVVLGFNEPNQQGQSDMTPQHAAQLWKQYIQPLKAKGYSLISPACTNAPSGIPWMQQFFSACDGCTFDGIAVHWYGTDANEMVSYLNTLHTTFNLPIWPTEFACQSFSGGAQCSMDDVWGFMTTVKNFMDGTDWIAHYFAFGALYNMGNVNPLNSLLASNGYPTDLGYFYINNS